jgi:hypothetical protein
MSHIDDGTLHAYLDGELPPMDRERVERHLAECPPCRARLTEERALIERAGQLLGLAVPSSPSRAAPPLDRLRQRQAWRHVRLPLVWAATIVLAVGLGWYLRGTPQTLSERPDEARVAVAPPPAAARQAVPNEAAETAPGAATPRPRSREQVLEPPTTMNSAAPPSSPAAGAAKVALQPQNEPVTVAGEAAAGRVAASVADEVSSRRLDRAGLSLTWAEIDSTVAHSLLGAAPATIPGYPIRTLRRVPGPTPAVAVEQDLENGTVVVLIERGAAATSEGPRRELAARDQDTSQAAAPAYRLAQPARERLARFIGPLRVEISGTLPADSLTRLLELVR